MEGTFAKIMCAFESKWEQFIEEGGFKGFMDEYQSRWLHRSISLPSYITPTLTDLLYSDQEVTLTTVEPHQRLRIKSITPDHGLLRCIPLDQGGSISKRGLTPLYTRGDFGDDQKSKESEFVDLQPDGNSFDMMSGLIKRKV
jgi:biotin--protein ligase